MAKFAIGDRVLVPVTHFNRDDLPFAVYRTTVRSQSERTVTVDAPPSASGSAPATISLSSKLAHHDIGIAIIQIGDFETEQSLLEPLRKSITQFFRLLLEDDAVRAISVRSLDELTHWWQINGAAYTHVVLIGHGRNNGIRFGASTWATPIDVATAISAQGRKTVVGLCCNTGLTPFARTFSQHADIAAFIAPKIAIHGAVASQICQNIFSSILLEGVQFKTAFTHAKNSSTLAKSFVLWRNGSSES